MRFIAAGDSGTRPPRPRRCSPLSALRTGCRYRDRVMMSCCVSVPVTRSSRVAATTLAPLRLSLCNSWVMRRGCQRPATSRVSSRPRRPAPRRGLGRPVRDLPYPPPPQASHWHGALPSGGTRKVRVTVNYPAASPATPGPRRVGSFRCQGWLFLPASHSVSDSSRWVPELPTVQGPSRPMIFREPGSTDLVGRHAPLSHRGGETGPGRPAAESAG